MKEPWWLQYLKSLFLEILFVTAWLVFQNRVTYMHKLTGKPTVNLLSYLITFVTNTYVTEVT